MRRLYYLDTGGTSYNQLLHELPSAVWFAGIIGLNYGYMVEMISLVGLVLSFYLCLHIHYRDSVFFLILWFLYLSIYKVINELLNRYFEIAVFEKFMTYLLQLAKFTFKLQILQQLKQFNT